MARKIDVKQILELRAAGMSQNTIAASRHASKHSVGDVFRIADEKGITYDSIAALSPGEVYRMFFPDRHSVETLYERPDYEYVHKELMRVGVTLKLLWEEYQGICTAQNKIPVGYTKFCEGYREYTISAKLTNHLEHKPGVVVEVDWSGPTMSYVDMSTGEIITVYLFVATLPYSQYSTHPEDMPDKFRITPWDDARMKKWAANIGEYTAIAVDRIFEGVGIKEQGYNSALALLKLSNKYSETRLEAACEYAITSGIRKPRYHHLNAILASNQDIQYMEGKQAGAGEEPPMGYLRGSGYYGGGDDNAE